MQGLDKEIAKRYGIDVKNIVPVKDAYILYTSKDRKMLRKSFSFSERILFVHGAKEHLYNNNFNNIDRYVCTLDGEPYFSFEGYNFVITDMPEGRECDFNNREDIIRSSGMLAELHKASKGYIPVSGASVQDELGKLPIYFNKRLTELRKLRKTAKRGRSAFDHLFLEYFDYYYKMGEDVINRISGSCYNRLVDEARAKRSFCHHDYTHSNIVFNNAGVLIINFEYCCYELKIYDIANFLRRKMRKCCWCINEARVIIDEYRSVESINDDEFYIMKLLLQFPQKFWRVANRFYNSKRSWSERSFVARLQEVIDEIRWHERFMERFDTLM